MRKKNRKVPQTAPQSLTVEIVNEAFKIIDHSERSLLSDNQDQQTENLTPIFSSKFPQLNSQSIADLIDYCNFFHRSSSHQTSAPSRFEEFKNNPDNQPNDQEISDFLKLPENAALLAYLKKSYICQKFAQEVTNTIPEYLLKLRARQLNSNPSYIQDFAGRILSPLLNQIILGILRLQCVEAIATYFPEIIHFTHSEKIALASYIRLFFKNGRHQTTAQEVLITIYDSYSTLFNSVNFRATRFKEIYPSKIKIFEIEDVIRLLINLNAYNILIDDNTYCTNNPQKLDMSEYIIDKAYLIVKKNLSNNLIIGYLAPDSNGKLTNDKIIFREFLIKNLTIIDRLNILLPAESADLAYQLITSLPDWLLSTDIAWLYFTVNRIATAIQYHSKVEDICDELYGKMTKVTDLITERTGLTRDAIQNNYPALTLEIKSIFAVLTGDYHKAIGICRSKYNPCKRTIADIYIGLSFILWSTHNAINTYKDETFREIKLSLLAAHSYYQLENYRQSLNLLTHCFDLSTYWPSFTFHIPANYFLLATKVVEKVDLSLAQKITFINKLAACFKKHESMFPIAPESQQAIYLSFISLLHQFHNPQLIPLQVNLINRFLAITGLTELAKKFIPAGYELDEVEAEIVTSEEFINRYRQGTTPVTKTVETDGNSPNKTTETIAADFQAKINSYVFSLAADTATLPIDHGADEIDHEEDEEAKASFGSLAATGHTTALPVESQFTRPGQTSPIPTAVPEPKETTKTDKKIARLSAPKITPDKIKQPTGHGAHKPVIWCFNGKTYIYNPLDHFTAKNIQHNIVIPISRNTENSYQSPKDVVIYAVLDGRKIDSTIINDLLKHLYENPYMSRRNSVGIEQLFKKDGDESSRYAIRLLGTNGDVRIIATKIIQDDYDNRLAIFDCVTNHSQLNKVHRPVKLFNSEAAPEQVRVRGRDDQKYRVGVDEEKKSTTTGLVRSPTTGLVRSPIAFAFTSPSIVPPSYSPSL